MSGSRPGDALRGRLALTVGLAVWVLVTLTFLVSGGPQGTVLIGAVTAAGYGTAGALLARARPGNPIGWLMLLVGVLSGLNASLDTWAGSAGAVDAPARTAAAWLASWVWFPAFALVPTVLLLLYPSGTLGSRSRRRLAGACVLGIACVAAALALSDSGIGDVVPGLQNPVAVEPVSITLVVVGFSVLVPSVLLSFADAVRRLRRAQSPEREQLLWLLLTVLALVVGSYTPWTPLRAAVGTLVPFAVAVGVVRHRLLDLQVVVRRGLLFLGLTTAIVTVFVASTAALGSVADDGPVPVAVAAALVAVGLTPLRERLQRGVDRLVYGDRADPVRVVAALGRQVAERDGDTLVEHVVTTVAAAVRSPRAVLLDVAGEVRAQSGPEGDGEPLPLALQVAGQDVGRLLVWPRTARDGWSRGDTDLLALLAQQVAVVAHAARLNVELASSRDRALHATAEERRRLRQELHDGLGPALSGVALGLEAAEAALARDPQRAAVLLARLREETQGAGREIRRLVEGLRPTALDGQSLADALHDFVAGLRGALDGRLDVALDVPDPLPDLPPDVDAAVYRIVTEAVTNVLRHSGARRCTVLVAAVGGELQVRVDDDGSGLPTQPRDGVGLTSMRRRAAELGGTWSVATQPGGGTRVDVGLPLGRPAGATS